MKSLWQKFAFVTYTSTFIEQASIKLKQKQRIKIIIGLKEIREAVWAFLYGTQTGWATPPDLYNRYIPIKIF